jgi:hypothetical protein
MHATGRHRLLRMDQSHLPLAGGQRLAVLRSAQDIASKPQLDAGTKIKLQCRTCPEPTAGGAVAAGCDY